MPPPEAETPLPLRRQVAGALIAVSSWQVAAVLAAVAGNVLLARLLGPRLLGAYAVSAFLLGLTALAIDFGIGTALIRRPGPESATFTRTAFTLTLGLALAAGTGVFIAAPGAAAWYRDADVAILLRLCYPGIALGAVFRLAQSLLEREMRYREVAATEALGTVAFFLGACALAAVGLGVAALAFGELLRGMAGWVAYRRRPFPVRPSWDASAARELIAFGTPYLGSVLTWNLTGAVNAVVVARILGLEAAGVVRIAEGLVNQLTLLKRVGERVASPVLARLQASRRRVTRTVELGQAIQFVLGALPLQALAVVGAAVVPWMYGARWAPVADLLPLLALGVAVSTAFGLHSRALVTIGRNSDVLRFHLAYAVLQLGTAPFWIARWGTIGYALAALAPIPAYWVVHRAFVKAFGPLDYGPVARLAVPTALAVLAAAALGRPWRGLFLFASVLAAVVRVESRTFRVLGRLLRGPRP